MLNYKPASFNNILEWVSDLTLILLRSIMEEENQSKTSERSGRSCLPSMSTSWWSCAQSRTWMRCNFCKVIRQTPRNINVPKTVFCKLIPKFLYHRLYFDVVRIEHLYIDLVLTAYVFLVKRCCIPRWISNVLTLKHYLAILLKIFWNIAKWCK